MRKDNNYSSELNNKLFNLRLEKLQGDLEKSKVAYPNDFDSMIVPGEHNLPKWVQTLKDVYYKHHQMRVPWKTAMDASTEGWSPMEKLDFESWVSYYQQGSHLKYKKASWYENAEMDDNGDQVGMYALPNAMRPEGSMSQFKEVTVDDVSSNEKSKLLASHKKKIVSRLDSIEKLLRSEEGYLLSEKEYDSLMESIHSLKKKVYQLQKKTSGDLFIRDLIVREANIMANREFFKAASLLYVVADEKAPATAKTPAPPPPTPPSMPTVPTASDAATGGTAQAAPMAADTSPSPNTQSIGAPPLESSPAAPPAGEGAEIPDLQLPGGPISSPEVSGDDDMEQFAKNVLGNDITVNEWDLFSLGQDAAPPAPAVAPAIAPAAAPVPEPIQMNRDFDLILENALGSIGVEDIVKKIEQISKIFKTREIPRQLSIVDMMLDHLGLASYFPSLSEATNKALEANNYILTRLEEIAMQLSGAVKTKEIDLTGGESPTPEAALEVKENLEEQDRKERERKEMRKELADKAMEERSKEEAPELEVSEQDLEAAPAPPTATPTPAAPTPPKPPV